jgi:Tol biopolymer transport system component
MNRISRFDRNTLVVVGALVAVVALTALFAALQSPAAVTGLQIAYLAPTRGPYNIWLVEAREGAAPRQVTFAEGGVFDFSVSADGRYIAYAEQKGDERIAELMLLDLETNNVRQLTDCTGQDAYCTTPVWRPDGKVIAYHRTELNSGLEIGPSAPRVWLLDMTSNPVNTFPLFQDSQLLTTEPQWSNDGSSIVVYESSSQSVMVYHFDAESEAEQVQTIPAGNGNVGALSPDGATLIFPELLPPGETTPSRAVLRVADLQNDRIDSLTPESELTDDSSAAWSPDGTRLAITRVYLDEARYTRGFQIYLMDMASRALSPLVVDADYQNSAISWSPDGAHLVFQRFKVRDADVNTVSEIWMVTPETDSLFRVGVDGFYPRWVK